MILSIERIKSPAQFNAVRKKLVALVTPFASSIMDDFSPKTAPESMVQNLQSTLPYLWVARTLQGQCLIGASLDDVIPGRHAYLHGVSHPNIRRHPALILTVLSALNTAFQELNVLKVKAEFQGNNLGAKGFCLRFGFKKEAHFKNDTQFNGVSQDTLVYSLFAHDYQQTIRRKMTHVLWQEKKQNPKNKNQRSPGHSTV